MSRPAGAWPAESAGVAARAAEEPGSLRALVLATLAFFVCFYVWALFGPLSPALQQALGIGDVAASWLVAIPVVLGSVLRVPMGVLTDRYGARRVFPALMAATMVPLLGIAAWHDSFAPLVGLAFLLGFAGSSFAVGVPYVTRWYSPARQGLALGVYGMGMGGTVLTGLTAPTLAQSWGIAGPFLAGAALVAIMAVLFTTQAQPPPRPAAVQTGLLEPLRVFAESGRAWALTLFYFLAFGGFVAMFLYLPKLLVGVQHLTRPDAGARAAGFALLAVVARPLGGYLADRVGAATVLGVSFAGTVVLGAVLAIGYAAIVPLTIACLGLAVLLGLGTGAVFKLVALEFPTRVGAVTGVVGAAGGLGGFFPPLVMAAVKTFTGSYTLGFALLDMTGVVCLLVLLAISRPRPSAVR